MPPSTIRKNADSFQPEKKQTDTANQSTFTRSLVVVGNGCWLIDSYSNWLKLYLWSTSNICLSTSLLGIGCSFKKHFLQNLSVVPKITFWKNKVVCSNWAFYKNSLSVFSFENFKKNVIRKKKNYFVS